MLYLVIAFVFTTGMIKIFIFYHVHIKWRVVLCLWTKMERSILKPNLPTFYDATRKFYAKELKPAEYKGVSGGFGCYGERGGETTMIRLRFTGGILEREDLIQLREAIKKYN